ncbi:MAG: divergent polysaccharide deacetylase family protein [Candidatus Hydrogenedentes bacterium]|nr:divergent polysaccharide deacetylase family protein [Candidatus Hydrogenedentota bacterium]
MMISKGAALMRLLRRPVLRSELHFACLLIFLILMPTLWRHIPIQLGEASQGEPLIAGTVHAQMQTFDEQAMFFAASDLCLSAYSTSTGYADTPAYRPSGGEDRSPSQSPFYESYPSPSKDAPLVRMHLASRPTEDPFFDECNRIIESARIVALNCGISSSSLSIEAVRSSPTHGGLTTRFMVVANGDPTPQGFYQALQSAFQEADIALSKKLVSPDKLLIRIKYQHALCVEFLVLCPGQILSDPALFDEEAAVTEGAAQEGAAEISNDEVPDTPHADEGTQEAYDTTDTYEGAFDLAAETKEAVDNAALANEAFLSPQFTETIVDASQGESPTKVSVSALPPPGAEVIAESAAAADEAAPDTVAPSVPVEKLEAAPYTAVPSLLAVPEALPEATQMKLAQAGSDKVREAAPDNGSDDEHPAYISIILDDGGYGGTVMHRVMELDPQLSLSILPGTPFARETIDLAMDKGFEIMLHMPMQAGRSNKNRFPGELRLEMSREEIQERTRECIAQFPEALGVNNHTGGLFTTDAEKMSWFLEIVQEEGLFFVDSRTIGSSCAFSKAVEMGIPAAERNIFLDHVNNIGDIRRRFKELMDQAKRTGWAIAIGHFRPNTVTVLSESLPKLAEQGIELVHISEMIW